MKKVSIVAFFLVVATSGIFAGGGGEKGDRASSHAIFGSSSLGGSWYPTASKLATVAIKYEDLSITVQSSGGGTENVRLMSQGQYQMGLVEPNIANYAYYGEKIFESDGPQTNLRVITNLYSNVIVAVVMKNSLIETLYDFNMDISGKKYGFAPGSPGSGDEYCWEEIFSIYGATKDKMIWKPLAHSERAMAFKDRILEGIGFGSAQPAGSIIEASAQTPIRILAIEGKEREELIKEFPWYYNSKVPAGMYNGIDADVEVVALGGFVMVNADVPDEFVYKFLSAMYGPGLKEVQSVVSATKEITLENAIVGNEAESVPFHPGAERFFKEKGILK